MSSPLPDPRAALPFPDFRKLRGELRTHLEAYSHEDWTDYNTHDPGITLGEHLCYGIHEASYVAAHPVPDLLTLPEGATEPPHPDFRAERVLPTRPWSALDYRRLLIDQPGVRNAWIEAVPDPQCRLYYDAQQKRLTTTLPAVGDRVVLHGFFRADIDFDGTVLDRSDAATLIAARLQEIRGLLSRRRNLCEEFIEVRATPVEEVAVCVDLDVEEEADLGLVMALVLDALAEAISPSPRFESWADLLDRGVSGEDVLEGPRLNHGHLPTAELKRCERPESVRVSDLVNVLSELPGVRAIRRVVLSGFIDEVAIVEGAPWVLPIEPGHAARLSWSRSRVTFYKNQLPFQVSEAEYRSALRVLRAERGFSKHRRDEVAFQPPVGRRRSLEGFPSLLNLLPENYGVGPAGLPRSATTERRSQASQLKAFFLFAEHLLAGNRRQASELREILSLDADGPVARAALPTELQQLGDLLAPDESTFLGHLGQIVESEEDRLRRRGNLLEHFLARFAESFAPYWTAASHRSAGDTGADVLASKSRLLEALPELARDRAAACDLRQPDLFPYATRAHAGIEERFANILGILDPATHPSVVYESRETGGLIEWSYRVLDDGRPILRSHRGFPSEEAAQAAVRAVFARAQDPAAYSRQTASDGTFFYHLVDRDGDIIARRFQFFGSEELRDEGIDASIVFFAAESQPWPGYLLEHILLRPQGEAAPELLPVCDPADPEEEPVFNHDPYSFRLTWILPARRRRFRHYAYRNRLEEVLREWLPAHLFLKICWVSDEAYADFGEAFARWRADYADEAEALEASRDEVVRIWRELRSLFPPATLHDCVDGNDENPVVLDHNALGTLEDPTP